MVNFIINIIVVVLLLLVLLLVMDYFNVSYDLKHIRQFDEEYIIISSAFLFLFISSFKIVASTGIRIHHLPYFLRLSEGSFVVWIIIIIKKYN